MPQEYQSNVDASQPSVARNRRGAILILDTRGLTQSDLARLFGSSRRAAEVLNGKRDPSKAMIRTLAAEWGLDANAADRSAAEGGLTPGNQPRSTPIASAIRVKSSTGTAKLPRRKA